MNNKTSLFKEKLDLAQKEFLSLAEELEKYHKNNLAFNENLNELSNITDLTSKLDTLRQKSKSLSGIFDNILAQQDFIKSELKRYDSRFELPSKTYSTTILGARDDRDDLDLKCRVVSRFVNESERMLKKINPNHGHGEDKGIEDVLDEIESQIVFII
ncbi:hypothetical protein SteCoe_34270 [Stentor coeruleus]|uniref:Uncharacterized protein n=1 Tax=Stentor coeruleus TaxID=5963 RepID=A0A1R2AUW6_9CILI|nr:hypothetical protein SteCoe_34270 [Stentor coeruleus]